MPKLGILSNFWESNAMVSFFGFNFGQDYRTLKGLKNIV